MSNESLPTIEQLEAQVLFNRLLISGIRERLMKHHLEWIAEVKENDRNSLEKWEALPEARKFNFDRAGNRVKVCPYLRYTPEDESYRLERIEEECRERALEELNSINRLTKNYPLRHVANISQAINGNHPEWKSALSGIVSESGKGSIFILHGRRGTGKTQLATAIGRYRAEMKTQESHYTVLGDLFTKIKGTFKSDSSESEDGIITQLAYAPLLVLDECHEITGTEWQCRILTLLIDARYRSKLDTILITNQSQEGFIASVGESIADRIAEVGYFIECDWTSFRRVRL